MHGAVYGVVALVLAGCATAPPQSLAEMREANEPLICASNDECTLMWRRAQVWVSENSRYRIQLATDTIIETSGPRPYAVERAYRIVRLPQADGRDRITIASGCANLFGCATTENADAISFKRYLRGKSAAP